MKKLISGYVLCFNNGAQTVQLVRAMLDQTHEFKRLTVIDDGSINKPFPKIGDPRVEVVRFSQNQGRGSGRAFAMNVLSTDFIASCDATNILPQDFVERLLPWFDDPKVAAVYGLIQDPNPQGVVGRWRARHLFKSGHHMEVRHHAPLITYGTIVRRSAVLKVGNFDSNLRHSEDSELGERLLAAGYDVIFDPSVPVYCNVQNSLGQVLERYWRWYAGKEEQVSWGGYWRTVVYSIKGMVWKDLRAGDPFAALISLMCPHYQFWKSW